MKIYYKEEIHKACQVGNNSQGKYLKIPIKQFNWIIEFNKKTNKKIKIIYNLWLVLTKVKIIIIQK